MALGESVTYAKKIIKSKVIKVLKKTNTVMKMKFKLKKKKKEADPAGIRTLGSQIYNI